MQPGLSVMAVVACGLVALLGVRCNDLTLIAVMKNWVSLAELCTKRVREHPANHFQLEFKRQHSVNWFLLGRRALDWELLAQGGS